MKGPQNRDVEEEEEEEEQQQQQQVQVDDKVFRICSWDRILKAPPSEITEKTER